MDAKPIITYSGAGPLFRSLESHIVSALPLDTSEWRQSYGRPLKYVRVEATFQPLKTKSLEQYKKGDWSILEHPVLHMFITECNDLETYKSSVKEEIDSWLKQLYTYGVHDWMILVVETLDNRKTKNLLPRATVLDKIRLDFCSKNDDRCISVLNPAKFEQKSTESFRCLVQRIRFLMLSSYNKNINKYEELIRVYREKRNQDGWDFIKYFFIQEDLALILEKLELYSEALVQYDELDAIFSQFITNSGFGEKQKWLESFKTPLSSFHGISLSRLDKFENRTKIKSFNFTILEFRNYLFERQVHLLQASKKPAEIASRLLSFLFSTLCEIEVIKVESPEGSLACWEFICALEVLKICDQTMEPNEITCFQNCAPIWNLAKDKLYELGKLCGLLPYNVPSSEQLHTVVQLSAGIGDESCNQNVHDPLQKFEQNSHSPHKKTIKSSTEKLKEALSSNKSFQKLYLELSELAISTYKHVSRLRSARLVGLDLGRFYCSLNEPQKAVVFFTDLLREFKSENCETLTSQILIELANCYFKMMSHFAYIKTCCAISCCTDLKMTVREAYFQKFLEMKDNSIVKSEANTNFCVLEDNFKICDLNIESVTPIIQDDIILVEIKLESKFPHKVFISKIMFSFEINNEHPIPSYDALRNPINNRRNVSLHLDYKQDNSLACASVASELIKKKQVVRRKSSTRRKLSPTTRKDFSNSVIAESINVTPGMNMIKLKAKATRVGIWSFQQLYILIEPIEFLSYHLPVKISPFEITTKPASAVLSFKNLIAGIEQPVILLISGGSFIFPPDAKIVLKCSKNLRIRYQDKGDAYDFDNQLVIPLQNFKSFENRNYQLEVLTELPGRNIAKSIEHKIGITCPWSRNELPVQLDFMPAITASCRLHTCGTQKFLQVFLKGLDVHLNLFDATMKCDIKGVNLIDLNPKKQNKIEIYKQLTVSYLYELQVEPLKTENELNLIKVLFSTKYSSYNRTDVIRVYSCAFDVLDYTTLFRIQAQLEPTELCRVRSVCNMHLRITKIQENPFVDLMYEVLTDQNLWAVCGRSAGVISLKDVESHSISLDVMPLNTGFLPMPSVRLSKYISAAKGSKQDSHPKLQPFPPGQVYNSTKSTQIHVLANNSSDLT